MSTDIIGVILRFANKLSQVQTVTAGRNLTVTNLKMWTKDLRWSLSEYRSKSYRTTVTEQNFMCICKLLGVLLMHQKVFSILRILVPSQVTFAHRSPFCFISIQFIYAALQHLHRKKARLRDWNSRKTWKPQSHGLQHCPTLNFQVSPIRKSEIF